MPNPKRLTRSSSLSDKNINTMNDFTQSLVSALKSPEVRKLLVDDIAEKVSDKINARLRAVEAKLLEKDAMIASLETKVCALENRLDDYEQYSRKDNLRITGIEETPEEDVVKKIINFSSQSLKVPLTESDISRAHRIGPKDRNKAGGREIIVKFTNHSAKSKIRKASKALKGTGIYINEDLTKYRSHLLYQARIAKRRQDINDAWSFEGNIAVKDKLNKVIIIKNLQQLEKLYTIPRPTPISATEVDRE